jgi:DNA replication protein DnaC
MARRIAVRDPEAAPERLSLGLTADQISTLPSSERQAFHNLALAVTGRLQPTEPDPPEPTDVCPTCKGWKYVRPEGNLPLDHPDFGKLLHCPTCSVPGIEQRSIERALRSSGVPGEFAAWTFEKYRQVPGFDGEAADVVEDWARRIAEGKEPVRSLLLIGATGKGKTGLAVSAMNLINGVRMRPHIFIDETNLFMELQEANGPDSETTESEIITRLGVGSQLAIIDDLGAAIRWTGFREEKLYQIISRRHAEALPTIITSNVENLDTLEVRVKARTYWRMVEMCGPNILLMEGQNLRDPRRPSLTQP